MENKDSSAHLGIIGIITCVLNALMMLASVTGNSLVLTAILRTPSLRSAPSTVFLCSLAVTDLLVGLVVQPVFIYELVSLEDKGLILLFASLCGVSLFTMTAISVDRFLALCYHLRYPNLMTTNRAIYTSASLWFVSILLSCMSIWKRPIFRAIMGASIAICMIICSVFYIKIYLIVRHHQIQIHAQEQAVNNFNICLNSTDNLNMITTRKTAVNTFIYYTGMLLCYLPTLIYSSLTATMEITYNEGGGPLVHTVLFLNSSINPFLYCWRNHEIRTSVTEMVRKIMCRQTLETS